MSTNSPLSTQRMSKVPFGTQPPPIGFLLARVAEISKHSGPEQAARIGHAMSQLLSAEEAEFEKSTCMEATDLTTAYHAACRVNNIRACRSLERYVATIPLLSTTRLDLTNTYLGPAGCTVFIDTVVGILPNLTTLILVRQGMTAKAVEVLDRRARAPGVNPLEFIDLSRNEHLGASAAVVLHRFVKNLASVHTLILSGTSVPMRYITYIEGILASRAAQRPATKAYHGILIAFYGSVDVSAAAQDLYQHYGRITIPPTGYSEVFGNAFPSHYNDFLCIFEDHTGVPIDTPPRVIARIRNDASACDLVPGVPGTDDPKGVEDGHLDILVVHAAFYGTVDVTSQLQTILQSIRHFVTTTPGKCLGIEGPELPFIVVYTKKSHDNHRQHHTAKAYDIGTKISLSLPVSLELTENIVDATYGASYVRGTVESLMRANNGVLHIQPGMFDAVFPTSNPIALHSLSITTIDRSAVPPTFHMVSFTEKDGCKFGRNVNQRSLLPRPIAPEEELLEVVTIFRAVYSGMDVTMRFKEQFSAAAAKGEPWSRCPRETFGSPSEESRGIFVVSYESCCKEGTQSCRVVQSRCWFDGTLPHIKYKAM